MSYDVVQHWFDVVIEKWLEYQYPLECVYNMDELGFAIRASQSSRALINVQESSSWKVIHDCQEWITVIECINAIGATIT